MPKLAILHSTIRQEEKLLFAAARGAGLEVEWLDIRAEIFSPLAYRAAFDLALERSVSTVKGNYAVAFFESLRIPVVNSLRVARNCEDKFVTSLLLSQAGIPQPRYALAFGPEEAKRAVPTLGGFPVVIKPPLGSWGRLLAKANDADALEAILEHKEVLGTPPQKAFYLQEFIRKPGRDIRTFVVAGEAICAIYREANHWITNTARGAVARNCEVTEEIRRLCRNSSEAVGGGLLAVDLFETENGLLVNEINHTMEFRNSEEPTGISISGAVVDYCLRVIKGEAS